MSVRGFMCHWTTASVTERVLVCCLFGHFYGKQQNVFADVTEQNVQVVTEFGDNQSRFIFTAA